MEMIVDIPCKASRNAASVKTVASSIRISSNSDPFDQSFAHCVTGRIAVGGDIYI